MNRIFVAALKEETPNLDYFFYTGVGKINASYNLSMSPDSLGQAASSLTHWRR